jgi:hypothetical protein
MFTEGNIISLIEPGGTRKVLSPFAIMFCPEQRLQNSANNKS